MHDIAWLIIMHDRKRHLYSRKQIAQMQTQCLMQTKKGNKYIVLCEKSDLTFRNIYLHSKYGTLVHPI